METRRPARFFVPLWLVWASALGLVFIGLGSYGILDDNEGLYAEISREMLASNDWHAWMIPRLNGIPYFEKPPLLYWLTAASFALFGESEWAARIIPALSAVACAAMLTHFGKLTGHPQAGRLAALMFISGTGVIVMSHVLMFDMLLTALLMAVLMFAYRWATEGRVRQLRLCYLFLALALLTKGLVALVLFGLVAAAMLLLSRHSARDAAFAPGKWFEPGALLILVAIAVPWHLVADAIEPAFAWLYFINEHLLRFFGMREPHDYYSGGWWYYLPRIAIYLFPWSFLLPCMIARPVDEMDRKDTLLHRFLLIAWLAPLAFFSFSSAKANYYLIVAMPPAAFHLALALERRQFLAAPLRALPGALIGMLAAMACAALVVFDGEPRSGASISGLAVRQLFIAIAGGIALAALGAAATAWRSSRVGILAYLALPIGLSPAMLAVMHALEPNLSTRSLARYLEHEQPGRAVYLYRDFEARSSLPFYLKRQIPIIDSRSNDLLQGSRLEPNSVYVSSQRFSQLLPAQPVAVVVTDHHMKDFKATPFFPLFKAETRIGETTLFLN